MSDEVAVEVGEILYLYDVYLVLFGDHIIISFS